MFGGKKSKLKPVEEPKETIQTLQQKIQMQLAYLGDLDYEKTRISKGIASLNDQMNSIRQTIEKLVNKREELKKKAQEELQTTIEKGKEASNEAVTPNP